MSTEMWLPVILLLGSLMQITEGNTAVLILARGGSKGIPLKNLQRVGDSSLLVRAIKTAHQAALFDVTVSTDHPLIALEALKSGARPFYRSRVTATDWAPSILGAEEFLDHRPDINVLVLMQATSPFVSELRLRAAIKKLNSSNGYDCVFSAIRSHKLRWRKIEERLYPVNFQLHTRPRRQDWDGEILETGAFYISRRHLIEKGYFQNNK